MQVESESEKLAGEMLIAHKSPGEGAEAPTSGGMLEVSIFPTVHAASEAPKSSELSATLVAELNSSSGVLTIGPPVTVGSKRKTPDHDALCNNANDPNANPKVLVTRIQSCLNAVADVRCLDVTCLCLRCLDAPCVVLT